LEFSAISTDTTSRLAAGFENLRGELQKSIGFSPQDMSILTPDLRLSVEAVNKHYEFNGKLVRLGGTVVGAAGLYAASRIVIRGLAQRVAGRGAAAAAARWTAGATGAGTAARVCPEQWLVKAVCAAAGFVGAYIATDSAVRMVDRFINEAELRTTLTNMVETAKAEVIAKTKQEYDQAINALKSHHDGQIRKSVRLFDYIRG
jgi:hypothetical protein